MLQKMNSMFGALGAVNIPPPFFAGHNLNEIPAMQLRMIPLRTDGITLHPQEALQLSAGKLV